jgi:hypothetical protein
VTTTTTGGGRLDRFGASMPDNTCPSATLPSTLTWRKSRASNPRGDCVELAVAVRNSRDPSGPALVYTPAEIAAFRAGAKAGEFDDLAG